MHGLNLGNSKLTASQKKYDFGNTNRLLQIDKAVSGICDGS